MKTSTNSVRVIAGKWRSRKLSFPDADGLRPTADRVRETLFNWLQTPVLDETCLDLFAGSGACGIEALSRGARHVSFVDSSTAALAALRRNLQSLDAGNYDLQQQDALGFLAAQAARSMDYPEGRYGIAFVDPPFAKGLLETVCQSLEKSGLLKPDALVYIESGSTLTQLKLPANWKMLKSRQAGSVYFCLCQRDQPAVPGGTL